MHSPLYYNFLQILNKLIRKLKFICNLVLILNPLGENESWSIHNWGTKKKCLKDCKGQLWILKFLHYYSCSRLLYANR
jgi:hypothetical protein